MNEIKPLSLYLKKLVELHTITSAPAQLFNELPPERQKQAVHAWPQAVDKAAHDLCDQLRHPEGKMLYQAPPGPAEEPSDTLMAAAGEDLLDRYYPVAGKVSWWFRDRILEAWKSQKDRSWWKWSLGLWLAGYFIVRPVLEKAVAVYMQRPAPIVPASIPEIDVIEKPSAAVPPKVTKTPPAPKVEVKAPIVVTPPVPAEKPPAKRFISSLAKNVLKNADGAIDAAIPIAAVSRGVTAVKDAAIETHEQAAAQSKLLPPAPQNLRWSRDRRYGGIQMVWDMPKGSGPWRYNLYAAYASDRRFDTGSAKPFSGVVATWIPPKEGIQVFELFMRAIDAEGGEGPDSNHITADLR